MIHRPASLAQSRGLCYNYPLIVRAYTSSSTFGVMAAPHASSSQPLDHSQHQARMVIKPGSTVFGHYAFAMRCSHSKLALKEPQAQDQHGGTRHDSIPQQLGLTDKQAARVLAYLSSQGRSFNIHNTRLWFKLLHKFRVRQPLEVISRHPIILHNRADKIGENAEVVVLWMSSMGLTPSQIAESLGCVPKLLCIPHQTAAAVAAWFSHELGWSGSMIAAMLVKYPQLFGLSVVDNLASKKAWYVEQGFSNKSLSKALFSTPSLFTCSIERNNTQFAALQALGLSKLQVSDMIQKAPTLLSLSINGPNTQAKIKFLTLVMGRQVDDMWLFRKFLTYSLFERIGPRWSFHSRHCPTSQAFHLSTELKQTDKDFAERMVSASLNAECVSRGKTCLQLFDEHRIKWQEGEGRQWNVRKDSVTDIASGSAEDQSEAGPLIDRNDRT